MVLNPHFYEKMSLILSKGTLKANNLLMLVMPYMNETYMIGISLLIITSMAS